MKTKQKKLLILLLACYLVVATACLPSYSLETQQQDYCYKYCTKAEAWFNAKLPDASSISYTYLIGKYESLTDVVYGEFYLNGQRFDYYLNVDESIMCIGGENIYNGACDVFKETIAEDLGIEASGISFEDMEFANVTYSLPVNEYEADRPDKRTGQYGVEFSITSYMPLYGYIAYNMSDEDVLKLIEKEFVNPSISVSDYNEEHKSEGKIILAKGTLSQELSSFETLRELIETYPIFKYAEIEDCASFKIEKDDDNKEYGVLSVYATCETDGFPLELMNMEDFDNVVFYPKYYLDSDKNLEQQISYRWNFDTPEYYTVCNDGPNYDINFEENDGEVEPMQQEGDGESASIQQEID